VKILTVVAVAALLLAGCARKNDTPEAIKQGVLRDISKSFNVANMDVIVDSVSFRDKEADATVTFVLKGWSGTTMASGISRAVRARRALRQARDRLPPCLRDILQWAGARHRRARRRPAARNSICLQGIRISTSNEGCRPRWRSVGRLRC
jgi:hypothetical protein